MVRQFCRGLPVLEELGCIGVFLDQNRFDACKPLTGISRANNDTNFCSQKNSVTGCLMSRQTWLLS